MIHINNLNVWQRAWGASQKRFLLQKVAELQETTSIE